MKEEVKMLAERLTKLESYVHDLEDRNRITEIFLMYSIISAMENGAMPAKWLLQQIQDSYNEFDAYRDPIGRAESWVAVVESNAARIQAVLAPHQSKHDSLPND